MLMRRKWFFSILLFGLGLLLLPGDIIHATSATSFDAAISSAQAEPGTPKRKSGACLQKQARVAQKSLQAVKAIGYPRIDGDLSEWANVPYVTLNASSADYHAGKEPYPSTTDLSMNVFAAWNDSFVWFAFAVTDDVVVEDSTSLWKDDEIELGIDGLNDRQAHWYEDDHQYLFTADGRDSDFGQRTPNDITFAARMVSGGWNVEVRIPRSELGFASTPLIVNQIIGFNLGIHDDDDGGDYETHLIWSGNSTNSSKNYGSLILGGLTHDFQATPTFTPTPTSTPVPTPANDDMDKATTVSVSSASFASTYTQNTTGATVAVDDPYFACVSRQGYHTVWYRITPLVNSRLTIDTFGSNYDTILAVWTGPRGLLSSVGCNDDSGSGAQSRVVADVYPGVTYYIEIAGFRTDSYGNLTLNVSSNTTVPTTTPTPTFTPTPKTIRQFIPWLPVCFLACDGYEPNNNISWNPWGPLYSGWFYRAKLCAGDPEDNYYFDTTTANDVQIHIRLPDALIGHFSIWLYAQNDLSRPLCGTGPVTMTDYSKDCPITHAGRYIVHLYTDGAADNVHSYTLWVVYR